MTMISGERRPTPKQLTAIDDLLAQVGELCFIYCGNGPSEQWLKTLERLETLRLTLAKARRQWNAHNKRAQSKATV